jgi:hypothetical protein
VRVLDGSGEVVDDVPFPGTMKSGLVRNLLVGTYRLEAETDTGLKASVTFRVEDLQLSRDVLQVALR